MREARQVPLGANRFALYLKKDGNQLGGRAVCLGTGKTIVFESLSHMVLLLEESMDLADSLAVAKPQGENPNFELEIACRQNSSWQGRLRRLKVEGEEPICFASVMELLILLETSMVA